jgi:hypothetical protein
MWYNPHAGWHSLGCPHLAICSSVFNTGDASQWDKVCASKGKGRGEMEPHKASLTKEEEDRYSETSEELKTGYWQLEGDT